MASVTKSWIETHCETCACRRTFLVRDGWVFVCTTCGTEKQLAKSGIVAV